MNSSSNTDSQDNPKPLKRALSLIPFSSVEDPLTDFYQDVSLFKLDLYLIKNNLNPPRATVPSKRIRRESSGSLPQLQERLNQLQTKVKSLQKQYQEDLKQTESS